MSSKGEMRQRFQEILDHPREVSFLSPEEIEHLILEAGEIVKGEGNLLKVEAEKIVFVGDTHGDFAATSSIISRYLTPQNKVVFLGDYVDRGPNSEENINYLLAAKVTFPQNLFLLQGNHEGRSIVSFYPADFWQGLDQDLYSLYSRLLIELPLAAVTPQGIIALHGVPPDVEGVEEINRIQKGDERWRQITWGDFREGGGWFLGDDMLTGRPQFGEDYFLAIMGKLKKRVLIRSHQPDAFGPMYEGRCLTLFTSSAYPVRRTIAISWGDREVNEVSDLEIVEL